MTEKSYIPVFTGADYKGWAFKVKFGVVDKELHDVVMDWGESPMQAKLSCLHHSHRTSSMH